MQDKTLGDWCRCMVPKKGDAQKALAEFTKANNACRSKLRGHKQGRVCKTDAQCGKDFRCWNLAGDLAVCDFAKGDTPLHAKWRQKIKSGVSSRKTAKALCRDKRYLHSPGPKGKFVGAETWKNKRGYSFACLHKLDRLALGIVDAASVFRYNVATDRISYLFTTTAERWQQHENALFMGSGNGCPDAIFPGNAKDICRKRPEVALRLKNYPQGDHSIKRQIQAWSVKAK